MTKPTAKAVAKPVAKPVPKPVAKPVAPAVEPVAAPVKPTTVVLANDTLTSRNGLHTLVLHDDGTLELRHRIDSVPTTSAFVKGQ